LEEENRKDESGYDEEGSKDDPCYSSKTLELVRKKNLILD